MNGQPPGIRETFNHVTGPSTDLLPDHAPWTPGEDNALFHHFYLGFPLHDMRGQLPYRSSLACESRCKERHLVHGASMLGIPLNATPTEIIEAFNSSAVRFESSEYGDQAALSTWIEAQFTYYTLRGRGGPTSNTPYARHLLFSFLDLGEPAHILSRQADAALDFSSRTLSILDLINRYHRLRARAEVAEKASEPIPSQDMREASSTTIARIDRIRSKFKKLEQVANFRDPKEFSLDGTMAQSSFSPSTRLGDPDPVARSQVSIKGLEVGAREAHEMDSYGLPDFVHQSLIPSTDMIPMVCQVCGYTLSGQIQYIPDAMANHVREKHPDADPNASARFSCPSLSCKHSFSSYRDLIVHMEDYHRLSHYQVNETPQNGKIMDSNRVERRSANNSHFRCPFPGCQTTWFRSSELPHHIRIVHLKHGRVTTLPLSLDANRPEMIAPQDLVTIFDQINATKYLLFDTRVSPQFAQSRVKGALSLCIPFTLLKRPSFNIQKLSETLTIDEERRKFARWQSVDFIIVYDESSADLKGASSSANLIEKFVTEGWQGTSYIVRGGFVEVSEKFPDLIEQQRIRSESPKQPMDLTGKQSVSFPSSRSRCLSSQRYQRLTDFQA